jgi:hypothetical protein
MILPPNGIVPGYDFTFRDCSKTFWEIFPPEELSPIETVAHYDPYNPRGNTVSRLIIALVAGTAALCAGNAIAAPLNPNTVLLKTDVEKVRMFCDQSGRCWRERGARRVVIHRESYGHDRRRRGRSQPQP